MKKIILFIAILFLITPALAMIEQHSGFPVQAGDELKAPLVAKDINGDGKLEIIAAPENRMVKVFTHTGALLWENTGGVVQYDTARVPLVTNLNGDGRLEILTYGNPGYSDPTFYIWDAAGIKLGEFPAGKYLLVSPPSITKEGIILTGAAPGTSFSSITQATGVYAFDAMGNKLWYLELGRSVNFMTSLPVGDIDGNGVDEAVILTQDINSGTPSDGKIWVVRAERTGGTILWDRDLGGDARGAAIADLNNDSRNEIVAASSSGIYIFDMNGNQLNNFKINSNRAPPATGDIDGDGVNDTAIASSEDNRIYIISSGRLKEFYAERVSSNLALGDINGDGKLEIAAGDLYGNMVIWDYKGNVIEKRPLARKYQYFTSAMIADLEGDGNKELILGNKNGNIYVWTVKTPLPPKAAISSPQNDSVYQLNSPVEFTSSSTDDDGIVSYKWESNIDGVIGETSSFSRILSGGWHNITLTVTDSDGQSNSTGVMIKVNKPPEAGIESPLNGAIDGQKDAVTLRGAGTDEDGYIALYQWTSDIDGVLSNAASFTSSSLSTGLHNITLTVTDNDGAAGSKTVTVNQTGYDVRWDLKHKQVMGEKSLLNAAGSVYKPESMVPIKFTVSGNGNFVVDKSVRVLVFDPGGREVFSAVYGNGSSSVRIDEEGRYIANFKSDKNDLPGTYRIEVRFDSQRKNQEFGENIYLLDQKVTYFANRHFKIKANTQGEAFTYEWKLGGTVIGTGGELDWVPGAPGIYNIQLFVTKNKNKIDTGGYSIMVNAEADSNGDDAVNVLDLSLLGLNWGKKIQDSDFEDGADVNGDGVIDIFDAVKIGKRWS